MIDQLTKFYSFKKFLSSATNVTASISTDTDKLDLSLVLIWFIALFAILTGALWTKHEFKKSLNTNRIDALTKQQQEQNVSNLEAVTIQIDNAESLRKSNTKLFQSTNKSENCKRADDSDNKNLTTISVGYVAIFVLLIFVVTMLLLLYFFYSVMSKFS